MAALNAAVEDAILAGELHDPVLAILLELLLEERRSGRFVFPDIMTEPILYRQMRQAVDQAVAALQATEQAIKIPGLEGLWNSPNSSRGF